MAGIDDAAHRDQRVGDAADRIGHAIVMHPVVAALEDRMDEERRAQFMGRLPEGLQRGIVQHAADALWLGADHGSGHARRMALAQHLRRAGAILQRHGGQRHEALFLLGEGLQMLIDEPRPGHALRARQFIAEHVEPAAGDLTVDLLLVHPLQASRHIAQGLGHGARGLAAREGEAEAARAIFHQLQGGEGGRVGADRLDEAGRADMGVAIDDHVGLTLGLRQSLRRPRR